MALVLDHWHCQKIDGISHAQRDRQRHVITPKKTEAAQGLICAASIDLGSKNFKLKEQVISLPSGQFSFVPGRFSVSRRQHSFVEFVSSKRNQPFAVFAFNK